MFFLFQLLFFEFAIGYSFSNFASPFVLKLWSDFDVLANDIHRGPFQNVLEIQRNMLKEIEAYGESKDAFSHSTQIKRTSTKNVNEKLNTTSTDIDVDLVFIGFPASAVDMIRNKWFNPLHREDLLFGSIHDSKYHQTEISEFPGLLTNKYHFHLVQISFHVENALRSSLRQLLRPTKFKSQNLLDVADYYLNSWEVEDLFDTLSKDIISSHNVIIAADGESIPITTKGKYPATTIFILNMENFLPLEYDSLKNGGSERQESSKISYSYKSGFTAPDIEEMASNEDIVDLVTRFDREQKKPNRINLEVDVSLPPLAYQVGKTARYSVDNIVSDILDHESTRDARSILSSQHIQWKDAIKTTRQWAKRVDPENAKVGKL